MQSQWKPFSHNSKQKEKEKKNTGEAERLFLLQVLIPIYNCTCKGLQGGTLCGPVFAIFEKDFKQNAAVVKKVILLEFVKACFANAFESMQSQWKPFNHNSKQKEEGEKKYRWGRKVVFWLQVLIPIYNCTCKGLQGGTLCGRVFCNFWKGF